MSTPPPGIEARWDRPQRQILVKKWLSDVIPVVTPCTATSSLALIQPELDLLA